MPAHPFGQLPEATARTKIRAGPCCQNGGGQPARPVPRTARAPAGMDRKRKRHLPEMVGGIDQEGEADPVPAHQIHCPKKSAQPADAARRT